MWVRRLQLPSLGTSCHLWTAHRVCIHFSVVRCSCRAHLLSYTCGRSSEPVYLAAKWLRNLSVWIFCFLPKLLILLAYFAQLWQQSWRRFLCRHFQAWILSSFNPGTPPYFRKNTFRCRASWCRCLKNAKRKQEATSDFVRMRLCSHATEAQGSLWSIPSGFGISRA